MNAGGMIALFVKEVDRFLLLLVNEKVKMVMILNVLSHLKEYLHLQMMKQMVLLFLSIRKVLQLVLFELEMVQKQEKLKKQL